VEKKNPIEREARSGSVGHAAGGRSNAHTCFVGFSAFFWRFQECFGISSAGMLISLS
jgi:hypothetical protein